MKALFLSALACILAIASQAQTAGVNEACSDTRPCASGLYCVKVKPNEITRYEYVCCECDQEKLRGYTEEKEKCCSAELISGIDKNPGFAEAKASDGRVEVVAFDKLMENVKKCREARTRREEACWDGGDPGHLQAIRQLQDQNSNLGSDKREWIDDKMVFYTTKSTYESSLSNFKYKCQLSRSEDMEDDIEDMEDDFEDGKAIDCDDLEDFIDECEKCQDAAADFLDDCFNDNISNMPKDYFDMFDKSSLVQKRAKELMNKAKSASLCE